MTESRISIPAVHMVRAGFARHAPAFKNGGYVGIGWFENTDLSSITSREELRQMYEKRYPNTASMNTAQNVGQVWRFLSDLRQGSYVVTPLNADAKLLVGEIVGDYYYAPNAEDSPYPHRKAVKWSPEPITRSALPVPVQNTLRSSLTIFQIGQSEEILKLCHVPLPERSKRILMTEEQLRHAILDQVLELSADEFEILVKDLLAVIGFEKTEHHGQPGDGGIDVIGTLRVYDFASIDIVVQVKRYKSGSIDHRTIKDFRSSVPDHAQGAFVTTSDFTEKARAEADKAGFKKIGLINGSQLVDILVEHYDELSEELRNKLNLRKTLIPK